MTTDTRTPAQIAGQRKRWIFPSIDNDAERERTKADGRKFDAAVKQVFGRRTIDFTTEGLGTYKGALQRLARAEHLVPASAMALVCASVHPELGLRFYPVVFVRAGENVHMRAICDLGIYISN